MDEDDKFLVGFSFNDLKLDLYGRYRNDDTFIPDQGIKVSTWYRYFIEF